MSPGFTSSKDRKKYIVLEKELNKEGIATLRFDFRGTGESGDARISIENEVEDLKAVLDFVIKKGFKEIILIGSSLGGLVSFKVYPFFKDKIKAIIGLAPVSDKANKKWEEKYMKVFEDKGEYYLFKRDVDGREEKFIIDKGYVEDRKSINQKELLSKIACPVLIIHGDKDKIIPLEHSKRAIDLLKNGKLVLIKEGNHNLNGKEEEIAEIIKEWIKGLFVF